MSAASRLVLFAPGAGAASTSDWMRRWADLLAGAGRVASFDYPYRLQGKRAPDRQSVLVRAHREALEREARPEEARLLVGKSMGSRIGCHVSLEARVDALVCLGYPLVGQRGDVRDAVLRELTTPVLFVQGTRDALCPLTELERVRADLRAPNELLVIDDGDHSLEVARRTLKAKGETQRDVDARILAAIADFAARYAPSARAARADQAGSSAGSAG